MTDGPSKNDTSATAEQRVILRVPRGSLEALPPLEFNMSLIYTAEARLAETEFASVHTANSLSGLFNMVSCETGKYMKKIAYELGKTQTLLRERKSDLLLDEWPNFMKENDLDNSKDMRDAFLMKDATYKKLTDQIDLLSALVALLQEKKDAFVRAYQQMKQLYVNEKRDPTYFGGNTNG